MNTVELANKSAKKTLDSVLILSVRNFRAQASNCALYEFENFICEVTKSNLVCPKNEKKTHRKIHRLSKYLTGSESLSNWISRFPSEAVLDEPYDVILVVVDNPWQLHILNQLNGWQGHPAKRVCYLTEFWPSELERWRLKKEPFENFNHVFVGLSEGVKGLQEQIDRPCTFLPLGVNTCLFSPGSETIRRCIDINYIGRRLPELHSALIKDARIKNYFYYFDTAKNQKLFVEDHNEHRSMYAQLLKRSVFSFAFPAKSNVSSVTGGIEEIGGRYYEFAASGVAIIGKIPNNPYFSEYFGWQDSVIQIPSIKENTLTFLINLLVEPALISDISRRNVVNSLRKNDWAYRWLSIVETLGFKPNELLNQKIASLTSQADSLEIQSSP